MGCQRAISPPTRVATTLRHPAGPSRGSSRTDAQLAGPVGRLGDLVDLDVGQPERAPGGALDDAAPEPVAELEGQVGAGFGFESIPAASRRAHVKVAGLRQVSRVELQMDDRA